MPYNGKNVHNIQCSDNNLCTVVAMVTFQVLNLKSPTFL
jgi:hypothetical protein